MAPMARSPSEPLPKAPRKRPAGAPTTDLVLSVTRGTSADLFPEILKLHVPEGSRVADTTHGRGVFWRNVPTGRYELLATDLMDGVDARALPYVDGSIDAGVFDPPWLAASSGQTHGSGETAAFETYYRNNQRSDGPLKYMDAILALYYDAAVEARRVLRPGGVYIVKCQDEVHANRQYMLHVDIIVGLRAMGFECVDLFVLVRTNRPGVSRLVRQAHARKAHSYFLVFRRARAPKTRAPRPGAL